LVDKEHCTAGERACSAGDVARLRYLLRVFGQSAINIATQKSRSQPSASKFHLSRTDKLIAWIQRRNCL